VLVVGAGLAGLVAARRLTRAGVQVTVVDAQPAPGGRVSTLDGFFPDRQHVELGGEFIDTRHTAIVALASELSLPVEDLARADAAGVQPVWYFGGALRSDEEVVEAFLPIAARVRASLAALGPGGPAAVTYRAAGGAVQELDRQSLAEWLDRAGAAGWARDLISVAFVTELGLDADRQSCLSFLATVDTHTPPFRPYGESDERWRIQGGNTQLVRALAEGLGGALQTGVALEALGTRADGALVASLRRGATSFTIAASCVVLALPFTLLRQVRLDVPLPPLKRKAIAELGYGTNGKLFLGFARRVWRDDHLSSGAAFTDGDVQCLWEASRLQPGKGGVLTDFLGGSRGVALAAAGLPASVHGASREIDRIFPGAAVARVGGRATSFHWATHPWARGSYSCYLPGQWTSLAGVEGEPAGSVFFAGEHCSPAFQGFMEGACRSGEAAAAAIIDRTL
jgi:monoamine oxidase